MRRVVDVARAGTWARETATATVTLAFADRHRRRLTMTDDDGRPFLLDLERATLLAEGDGLMVEGGSPIDVRAAEEAVLEAHGPTMTATVRLAWHVGNRHTPMQVLEDGRVRLLDDPVLATMLDGLGATVVRRRASFHPEAGAYDGHRHGDKR